MKRIIFIVIAITLLITGCSKPENKNRIKGYQITIFYGFSSYAMFNADQAIISNLLNQFNSLSFEKTTEEIDLPSAFNVNISDNGNSVKSFWVDKQGVFWLNGETKCYKASSGSFNYKQLKAIYETSKNNETGIALPDNYKDKNVNKSHELELKNELLIMIDNMTKPTQEKPYLKFSSNPYDYINAHNDTYNSLLSGGQSTVNIFVEILRNSTEFGLDKYIMAVVCAEITGIGSGDNKTWATANEWLELYDKVGEKI